MGKNRKMNIDKGFQIDEPNVFVPWDIDEKGLENLLGNYGLRKIKDGYHCISCKSLGGLSHELGFHFEIKEDENKIKELENYLKSFSIILMKVGPDFNPKREGKLKELEFFRQSYQNLKESFDEFQAYFEKEFGKPRKSKLVKNGCGFMHYEWKFRNVRIYHYLMDRFGPEEHLRIERV